MTSKINGPSGAYIWFSMNTDDLRLHIRIYYYFLTYKHYSQSLGLSNYENARGGDLAKLEKTPASVRTCHRHGSPCIRFTLSVCNQKSNTL